VGEELPVFGPADLGAFEVHTTSAPRLSIRLGSVRDLETAEMSAEEIPECADRFDAISEAFTRLGPLSPALKARQLKRLEVDDRESTMTRGNVRELTPEEAKVITPAAEIYFEKWLAAD